MASCRFVKMGTFNMLLHAAVGVGDGRLREREQRVRGRGDGGGDDASGEAAGLIWSKGSEMWATLGRAGGSTTQDTCSFPCSSKFPCRGAQEEPPRHETGPYKCSCLLVSY